MKFLPFFVFTVFLLALDSKKTNQPAENIGLNGVRIIEDKDLLNSIDLEDLTKNAKKVKPIHYNAREKKSNKDL
ncbi:hypothetical protein BpHYR1_045465 [Brachionus plicatilis]|uniref:Uncharacterized protein n=1 Tax=Brachionus plicatilis TaxID=10195 RepID=A0A3M7T4M7_BRAPC|nr:hypothetical protein BpHYR1_045465 [Brachionus plicatilis]